MGAAVIGATASTGIAAASATPIKEAGSSAVEPLVSIWSVHYTANTVTYAGGGSSVGIEDAANPSSSGVNIGTSDAPETSLEYGDNSGTVLQIPWALTGATASYHIAGVGEGLKLSGKVLAEIFTGKITNWNNAAITKANPTYAKALDRAGSITPVYRTDGSGDSYDFQHFLTDSAGSAWPYGYSTAWGASTGVGENGNAGVAGEVRKVSSSIGYISAYYAISQRVDVAAIENADGKYILPNATAIQAASRSNAAIPAQGPNFGGLSIIYPSKKYKTAYPIAAYDDALVNLNQSSAELSAIQNFVQWALSPSEGQRYGGNLDFVPLPAAVLSQDAGLVSKIS